MDGHEQGIDVGRGGGTTGSRHRLAPLSRVSVVLVGAMLTLPAVGPTAVAQSEAGAPDAWTRVELPGDLVGLELHDVAAGGPGFIAVGGGFREGSSDPEALILASTDGLTWQRAELEAEVAKGQMRAVISVGGAWYMAVGGQCCPDVAAVWISVDGLSWQRLPDSPQFFSGLMTDVAVTSAGFLAVGCQANLECSGGAVWQSADGATWQGSNPFLWIPSAVVATTTSYVAVGQTDLSGGRPVAASSADGTDWQPAALPDVVGALNGVIAYESAVMAVGETRDPDTMQPTGYLITSGDGTEWGEYGDATIPGASYADVLVSGDATLLVGTQPRPDGTNAPASWLFAEGSVVAGTFASAADDAWVRSIALGADGTTAVIVGTVFTGAGSTPGIWVNASPT
jgi:hypothetical protein